MDKGTFLSFALLGTAAALAAFYPMGAQRRARVPPALWWFCLALGGVVCIYGLVHSTTPSFAPRMVAVGKAYDCVEIQRGGRSAGFGFHFTPDGGDGPLVIETTIIVPGWGTPEVFNGRTFRVVYLQSIKRTLKNEAIGLDILSGRDAGFHDSIDARPFGSWLLIPIGAAFATFGYFGIRYRKDDKDAATTS